MTPEPVMGENLTALIATGRERERQPLGGRRALTEAVLGGGYVAIAIVIAVSADADTAFAFGPTLALVLVFAAGFRFLIDLGVTYTAPVQLAFVPMLLLLPTPAVPLLILLAWALGRAPDLVGPHRIHPDRLLLIPGNCWFCIGPVLVLLGGDAQTPDWSKWPIYLLALASQFVGDTFFIVLREWIGDGMRPEMQLRTTGLVAIIDALLSPLGLLAAFASESFDYAFLLLVPPALLFSLYARERSRSVEGSVALASALRDREDLIAGARHELVTPLGVLVGLTARLTGDGPELAPERRAQLDTVMRREVIALRHVVRQFVDYTRLKTERDLQLRPAPTRLEPVAAEIVIALTGLGRVGVTPTDPLPPALVDPDRAHQMVMSVTAEALEGAEAVALELGVEDERLQVTVTSPQPLRERPFAEGGEGSNAGLGLYVTRELARRQDGELEAFPHDGGARYVLSLPLA